MNFFKRPFPPLGGRPVAQACAVILFLPLVCGVSSTHIAKNIMPHNFTNFHLSVEESPLGKGQARIEMETGDPSFLQGGTGDNVDMWVGLLDQEYIMQTSHSLVLAFKRSSKYIYSRGFIRDLFQSNEWLKYSILSMEKKLEVVKQLEKISKGSKLRYWNKPDSAAKWLTQHFLKQLFPMRKRLFGVGRRKYQEHFKSLKQVLLEKQAGSSALNQILASNTIPMFSWAESFFKSPLATIQGIILQTFEDAVGGVSGLLTNEVKKSCFSFAYRANPFLPYTAAYPGGILGSIMSGLVRSYFLVFQQTLVNFKGIFALLIGVICKTRIAQAATNALKPIFRIARRGIRAIQAFKFKTIGLRGDPVGQGLIDRMMKRDAVVLLTILFQLHAVDVEKQYSEADNINNALLGGSGSWALTEGLFIGAAEFGRAFHKLVNSYKKSASNYVNLCEADFDALRKLLKDPEILESALEYFPSAHPETSGDDDPLSPNQKTKLLLKSCSKHRTFVIRYKTNELFYVQRVVQQMVRVLRYYFKYFKAYISDILAIFYETALAMLETKVNDSTAAIERATSPAEEIGAAEARSASRRATAQTVIEEGQLPRKLYRARQFGAESEALASGFFEAAGGFSLFKLLVEAEESSPEGQETLRETSFRLLTSSEKSLRKGIGDIYKRFLNSQIIISRIERNKRRLKVFEIFAKCRTPLEGRTEAEKDTCGTIVTTEIDQDGFIGRALLSVNLSISGPANDIAFKSTEGVTLAFKTWSEHATNKGNKTAAEIASRNADPSFVTVLAEQLSSAAVDKLTFHRLERTDQSNKLILYDKHGRSLTFTGEEEKVKELFHPTPDPQKKGVRKPDPLDCRGHFRVKTANEGTLEFYLPFQPDEGDETELKLKPGIELEGVIEYNDERKELRDIQNDPDAIRDTIVAHLIEKRERIPAEMIANILHMLHHRLPIFWKASPVEFLQNLTPKMFFDAISILSIQPYHQEDASVVLDGKLYTFPKSFSAIKDIVLSALNRAIIRMHNLKATDAALLIAMGSLHFAYKKIQKHRTGRTALMHLFLKEVNHLMANFENSDDLNTSYPECTFFNTGSERMEELVIKCALFRFMKIGPLEIKDNELEVKTYVEAFLAKLTELKRSATWKEYLNLGYFAKAAKKYGKTAAKYKYELLFNQLNDIRPTEEEESELAKLMKKLHPSVAGQRPPRPKRKQGFLILLKNLREHFDKLPAVIRQRVSIFWRNCYARMRRFFGSRRFWFYGWKAAPKVIQGPHFMGALKSAEITTYPNIDTPRELFIQVADLEEFGKVLLLLEAVAATLDNPASMYNTVTQLRSTPAFTPLAKEQHDNLIKRAKLLGKEVVKVAAGWVLKVAAGSSGVSMALGLLALVDGSGRHMEKALQLRYLSSEALAFLDSSLDLGYLLMRAPQQSKSDVKMMRFYLNHQNQSTFAVKAQCEPKGLGINTMENVEITSALKRLEDELERQKPIGMEGFSSTGKDCESLVPEQLREFLSSPSISHEILVAAPDAFSLCYLWRKLKADLVQQKNTTTIEDILQSVYVDNQPLSAHLDFLQQRSASSEERKVRAKFVGSVLRNLFIATVDKFNGQLRGLSFKSYDGETKVLQFHYSVQHVSPTLAPGQALEYATDLLLGKKDNSKCSFVSFMFEGPQFLMDWYRYVDPKKLRAFVDDLRAYPRKQLRYKDIRNLSHAYTVTDLTDIAYSLRQSSKLNAEKVAKAAALTIMETKVLPPLKDYGVAKLLVDLVSHAKEIKQKCVVKVLDDYEVFSSLSLLNKEMFKYDCFYHQMADSNALSDAAMSVSDSELNAVILALDTAYENETKRLYEGLLKSNVQQSAVAKAVFETAENLPISGMVTPLLNSFLSWVRQEIPWENIKPILKGQRSAGWVATEETLFMKRRVTNLEHPLLMNPYLIVIDVIFAATTGSARRRLFPMIAPLKRLKAFYAIVKPGRASRAEMKADQRERRHNADGAFQRYMQKLAKKPEFGSEITASPTDA